MIEPTPTIVPGLVKAGANLSTSNVRAPQTFEIENSYAPGPGSSSAASELRSPQDIPPDGLASTSKGDAVGSPSSVHAYVPPPKAQSPLPAPPRYSQQQPPSAPVDSMHSERELAIHRAQPYPQVRAQPAPYLQPHIGYTQQPYHVPMAAATIQSSKEAPQLPISYIPLRPSMTSSQPMTTLSPQRQHATPGQQPQSPSYATSSSGAAATLAHSPSHNADQPPTQRVRSGKTCNTFIRKWLFIPCALGIIAVLVTIVVVVPNRNKHKSEDNFQKPDSNNPSGRTPGNPTFTPWRPSRRATLATTETTMTMPTKFITDPFPYPITTPRPSMSPRPTAPLTTASMVNRP